MMERPWPTLNLSYDMALKSARLTGLQTTVELSDIEVKPGDKFEEDQEK